MSKARALIAAADVLTSVLTSEDDSIGCRGDVERLVQLIVDTYENEIWQPMHAADPAGPPIVCLWNGELRVAKYLDNSDTAWPWKGWIPLDCQPYTGKPSCWREVQLPERMPF